MVFDHSWMLGRARAFLGQAVVGQVDFTDQDMLRLLDEVTLPIFSVYMPHYIRHSIDCARDRAYADQEGVFVLRPAGGFHILGVSAVIDSNISADWTSSAYDPRSYTDLTDRQFATDYMSATNVDMTFDFSPPNIVEITPKGFMNPTILVQLKVVHPPTLRTVQPGAIETLKELFLADLATDLLGVRQYFQQLSTVFGEIQLNLDPLREKAAKRDEMIQELRRLQLKTGKSRRIFIG